MFRSVSCGCKYSKYGCFVSSLPLGCSPPTAAPEAIIALNLTSETAPSKTPITTSLPRCQQNMAKGRASCRVASQGHSGWPLGKQGRCQSTTTNRCLTAWCHIFQFLSHLLHFFHKNDNEIISTLNLFISLSIIVLINFDLTSVTNLSCLESNQLQCLTTLSQSHLLVS